MLRPLFALALSAVLALPALADRAPTADEMKSLTRDAKAFAAPPSATRPKP